MLGHRAYITHLTSSYHTGTLSSHVITKKVSSGQQNILRKTTLISRTFITVSCYKCLIFLLVVVVNLLLCII